MRLRAAFGKPEAKRLQSVSVLGWCSGRQAPFDGLFAAEGVMEIKILYVMMDMTQLRLNRRGRGCNLLGEGEA